MIRKLLLKYFNINTSDFNLLNSIAIVCAVVLSTDKLSLVVFWSIFHNIEKTFFSSISSDILQYIAFSVSTLKYSK